MPAPPSIGVPFPALEELPITGAPISVRYGPPEELCQNGRAKCTKAAASERSGLVPVGDCVIAAVGGALAPGRTGGEFAAYVYAPVKVNTAPAASATVGAHVTCTT